MKKNGKEFLPSLFSYGTHFLRNMSANLIYSSTTLFFIEVTQLLLYMVFVVLLRVRREFVLFGPKLSLHCREFAMPFRQFPLSCREFSSFCREFCLCRETYGPLYTAISINVVVF